MLGAHAQLRPLLVKLTYPQVQEIKDQIAEIAPVWEGADLTSNLWCFVKAFDFSKDARREINGLIEAAKGEVKHATVTSKNSEELIPNINLTELQNWLNDYAEFFSDMEGRLSVAWIVGWRILS